MAKPQSPSFSLKKFLVTSLNFWFSISIASSTLSLLFLSFSSFTNRFGTLFILSTALHSLIFTSRDRLRILMEDVLHHKPLLYALLINVPLTQAAPRLSRFPDNHSVSGLFFSIFFAIDFLALIQIVRPPFITIFVLYLLSEVAVDRGAYLYGFWGSCFMYAFTAGIVGFNIWLEQAIKEDSKKKMAQVTDNDDGDDKDHNKLPPTSTSTSE